MNRTKLSQKIAHSRNRFFPPWRNHYRAYDASSIVGYYYIQYVLAHNVWPRLGNSSRRCCNLAIHRRLQRSTFTPSQTTSAIPITHRGTATPSTSNLATTQLIARVPPSLPRRPVTTGPEVTPCTLASESQLFV